MVARRTRREPGRLDLHRHASPARGHHGDGGADEAGRLPCDRGKGRLALCASGRLRRIVGDERPAGSCDLAG